MNENQNMDCLNFNITNDLNREYISEVPSNCRKIPSIESSSLSAQDRESVISGSDEYSEFIEAKKEFLISNLIELPLLVFSQKERLQLNALYDLIINLIPEKCRYQKIRDIASNSLHYNMSEDSVPTDHPFSKLIDFFFSLTNPTNNLNDLNCSNIKSDTPFIQDSYRIHSSESSDDHERPARKWRRTLEDSLDKKKISLLNSPDFVFDSDHDSNKYPRILSNTQNNLEVEDRLINNDLKNNNEKELISNHPSEFKDDYLISPPLPKVRDSILEAVMYDS